MHVVLDTNVLISGLGWHGPEYLVLQKCFQKVIELVFSPETLAEFKAVALRPKFEFSSEEIEDFTSALLEVGKIVLPEEKINEITEDLKDNLFLEAAVAGQASYIISGDKHLLQLGEFRSIKIMRSRAFLTLLQNPT
jgi:putative PIN family toxin of toxin-antitoxin system